jgi:hypothetical protein
MAVAENKKRLNVTISLELADWLEKQAEGYGCSVSSMIALAIGQYKQQCEGLSMMKDMGKLYELIEQVQKQQSQQ